MGARRHTRTDLISGVNYLSRMNRFLWLMALGEHVVITTTGGYGFLSAARCGHLASGPGAGQAAGLRWPFATATTRFAVPPRLDRAMPRKYAEHRRKARAKSICAMPRCRLAVLGGTLANVPPQYALSEHECRTSAVGTIAAGTHLRHQKRQATDGHHQANWN